MINQQRLPAAAGGEGAAAAGASSRGRCGAGPSPCFLRESSAWADTRIPATQREPSAFAGHRETALPGPGPAWSSSRGFGLSQWVQAGWEKGEAEVSI